MKKLTILLPFLAACSIEAGEPNLAEAMVKGQLPEAQCVSRRAGDKTFAFCTLPDKTEIVSVHAKKGWKVFPYAESPDKKPVETGAGSAAPTPGTGSGAAAPGAGSGSAKGK